MLSKSWSEPFPSVTIAIPTYNEAAHIEHTVRDFLATNYLNLVEIFVADGGSTDGTQEMVKRLSAEDPRVKLLDNSLKIQSAGLNLILNECTGCIFIRADAHGDYAPDYIERCVEALLESQALNVGGAQRFAAKTPFQAGVALASRSFLGNGGAKYRDPTYDGYADTVYLGCFWKKALLNICGYNTNNYTNEDSELNVRLANSTFDTSQLSSQDAGPNLKLPNENPKAIYISSKIRVWYYPRKTWNSLWIQYFKYGRGRYLTTIKHSNNLQLRGKLPSIIILFLIFILLTDLFFIPADLHIKEFILLSLLIPFLEGLRITLKFYKDFRFEFWRGNEEKIPSFVIRWLACSITLLTLPLAHSSGYLYQSLKHQILRTSSW